MLDLKELGDLSFPSAGRLVVVLELPLQEVHLVLGESRLGIGLLGGWHPSVAGHCALRLVLGHGVQLLAAVGIRVAHLALWWSVERLPIVVSMS